MSGNTPDAVLIRDLFNQEFLNEEKIDPELLVRIAHYLIKRKNKEKQEIESGYKKHDDELNCMIRELNCVNTISEIMDNGEFPVDDMMHVVVRTVPAGMSYSDVTCARITINGKIYQTDDFKMTRWCRSDDIEVDGRVVGTIDICYLDQRPDLEDGPFLNSERSLVHMISEKIGRYLDEKLSDVAIKDDERFGKLFDSYPKPITMLDKDGRVIDANRASLELAGVSKKEAVGKPFLELGDFARDYNEKYLEMISEMVKDIGTTPREMLVTKKEGERQRFNLYPALIDKNKHATAILLTTQEETPKSKK